MAEEGAPKKRPGGRSARIHQAVLKSAFDELSKSGFRDFSIADVAARAGVHETSIYRRWGSREALALDASLHFADDAIAIPDTGVLKTDLMEIMQSAIRLLGTPRGQAMLALVELRDDNMQRLKRAYWRERFSRLRPVFDRAIKRGEFPADADPIIFLETLVAPLYFRLLVSMEAPSSWPLDEQVDRLLKAYVS
ncbi:TetR/AcrR family transcriptional regulator [Bradyrhizobium sp. 48]|uniref:TetR/AcrR family transcriptional regulator n=1 Tax=Bradyrhizobium sp. 48 TaxID=2782676 RepID=UPI001FF93520|nr:TetR/AcrR family transcriptional regulator [Bradyrhizobium sp. 48]